VSLLGGLFLLAFHSDLLSQWIQDERIVQVIIVSYLALWGNTRILLHTTINWLYPLEGLFAALTERSSWRGAGASQFDAEFPLLKGKKNQ
jgi:hypothetical protein